MKPITAEAAQIAASREWITIRSTYLLVNPSGRLRGRISPFDQGLDVVLLSSIDQHAVFVSKAVAAAAQVLVQDTPASTDSSLEFSTTLTAY